MKTINLYNDKTAYEADNTRQALTESTLSQTDNDNELYYDGYNLVVECNSAERGDIVVFDTIDLRKKVVKLNTYVAATLPTRYIVQDAVYVCKRGAYHYVLHKSQVNAYRWAQGYQVKLLGLDLVNGGSFTFTATCGTAGTGGEITYPAGSTYASIAALINTALGSAATSNYWKAYVWTNGDNSGVYMEHNGNTGGVLTITASSPTVTTEDITPAKYQITASGLQGPISNVVRKKGISSYYAGNNYSRFLAVYTNSGVATANISGTYSSILKLSAFNEIDNPTLFEKYNGNYGDYIASEMIRKPLGRGAQSQWNQVGKELAAITYTNPNGVISPAYPEAYYAAQVGAAASNYTTGLEVGNYFLPDLDMVLRLTESLPYSLTADFANDSLNKGLSLIGGTPVRSDLFYVSSAEHSAAAHWIYHGNGTASSLSKFLGNYGRAVVAFEDED